MSDPVVSFVISTFNRRAAVLGTLAVLGTEAAGSFPSEVLVVDNASADGTADAVAREFPDVRLFRRAVNAGACAKNVALPWARGRYVVFLDDDSYPTPGSVDRMVGRFEADPSLGAAVFDVVLPGGGRECSAYPDVLIGCGTGLRADALRQVGGLPDDFFMQAEEYDLSLRLLDAGWDVRRFDDLRVTHLKTPAARFPARVTRLDVRNNLAVVGRYFPDDWVLPFAFDWADRYRLIAAANGRTGAWCAGLAAGVGRLIDVGRRRPVSAATFERFAKVQAVERGMRSLARDTGARRVLFIDLENILPYRLAARRCGLEVLAVADAKLGGRGFAYRGVPVVTDDEAGRLPFDVAVVSNLSPVHAEQRRVQWRRRTDRPVVDLFETG